MSSEAAARGRVGFIEVGPRDGLQNLKEELSTEAKVELVGNLLDCSPDLVEATSFVSPKWVPQLADAEAVLVALVAARGEDVLSRLRVLVPNQQGLERALASGARCVLANIGATDSFNLRNLNRERSQTLAEIGQMAAAAARAGCRIDASISVAFGCPFEGAVDRERVLELAWELAQMGVGAISVADTIGVADPLQVERMLDGLEQRLPRELIWLHLHDTRGMALANALVAYRSGVSNFEGSVGGIGGCPFAPKSTGNVCSEDLLHMLARVGGRVAVDLARLCRVAVDLERQLGRQLPGRLYRSGSWPADRLDED